MFLYCKKPFTNSALTECCMCADLDLSFSRLKQEHGEVATKDKEVGRLTQLNHQLQDEVMGLKNTLADYSLCKQELEGYKKEIQEKVRLVKLSRFIFL